MLKDIDASYVDLVLLLYLSTIAMKGDTIADEEMAAKRSTPYSFSNLSLE
jgi:hypothetical protein